MTAKEDAAQDAKDAAKAKTKQDELELTASEGPCYAILSSGKNKVNKCKAKCEHNEEGLHLCRQHLKWTSVPAPLLPATPAHPPHLLPQPQQQL
jgi:hypothetical protein